VLEKKERYLRVYDSSKKTPPKKAFRGLFPKKLIS